MAGYGALWRARIEMLRPGNAGMAAAGVALGILLVSEAGTSLPLAAWLGAPLAAFAITGFGNVINDIADAATDATAHPERPIPSGRLAPRDARGFAGFLLLFGLWEAWLAGGVWLTGFAAANAALLVAYEWRLKAAGLPGNLAVAALVGSTFLFGAVAARADVTDLATTGPVWALAAMAGLANLARELVKDIDDAEHDAATRRTFPMRVGVGPARLVAAAAVLAAITGSACTAWQYRATAGLAFPALLAAADVVFVAAVAGMWQQGGRASRRLKVAMLLGMGAFGVWVATAWLRASVAS